MKVLQLCYKMPYPIRDGGEYSIYHSGLSLMTQENVELKVIAINSPKFWVEVEDMPKSYREATRFEAIQVDTRIKLPALLKNLFSRQSYFVSRFYDPAFEQKLIEVLQHESFDILLLEHVYLCCYLECLRKHSKAKVVLRAQNIEFQLWESYTRHHKNPVLKAYLGLNTRKLKRFEKAMFNQLDGLIALTENDKNQLVRFAPETPAVSIAIGFDFDKLKGYDAQLQFRDPPLIYHLGSMDWRPNIQGVSWFISEVLPLLIQQRPDIRIHLAGKKMPASFYEHASPQLIIDGEVEDAMQYQQDKAILIVPLLSGGGIRVKIIEGLAMGKTIVSTTKGAEGIPYEAGKHLLIADTAEAFAAQLIRAYDDPELCRSISHAAKKLAGECYELGAIGRRKVTYFRELLGD